MRLSAARRQDNTYYAHLLVHLHVPQKLAQWAAGSSKDMRLVWQVRALCDLNG